MNACGHYRHYGADRYPNNTAGFHDVPPANSPGVFIAAGQASLLAEHGIMPYLGRSPQRGTDRSDLRSNIVARVACSEIRLGSARGLQPRFRYRSIRDKLAGYRGCRRSLRLNARRTPMIDNRLVDAIALTVALLLAASGASAHDESKYPDLKGQWDRVGPPNWTPAGTPPLTVEYQAVYEANRADMRNGGPGGVPSQYCYPQGVPMMMNIYDPMEIVITADITYILISHVNDSYRRIYTDGKGWPNEDQYVPTYNGYSVGRWIDEDGDGK